jgi:anhydro-N-acetylmuramic acid kinase
LAYAKAVSESLAPARLSAKDLSCIAAHGQTLFHDPPSTIQWFDPALVAAEVGCSVVSDFRRADCAVGGQGAPLVPFADYILFRHPTKNRLLLNIGGIANITWLKAGGSIDDVIAFDTGPGNCISDHLVREHDPSGLGYDKDGEGAAAADWIEPLAKQFLAHPYFDQLPPKSTDVPEMIDAWRRAVVKGGQQQAPREMLLATACYVTVAAISDAVLRNFSAEAVDVIAAGGGTRNQAIMNFLDIAGFESVTTTDELGIPADAREAMAFALLAAATLDGLPSNVPSVTGAKRAVVLGSITPKP